MVTNTGVLAMSRRLKRCPAASVRLISSWYSELPGKVALAAALGWLALVRLAPAAWADALPMLKMAASASASASVRERSRWAGNFMLVFLIGQGRHRARSGRPDCRHPDWLPSPTAGQGASESHSCGGRP